MKIQLSMIRNRGGHVPEQETKNRRVTVSKILGKFQAIRKHWSPEGRDGLQLLKVGNFFLGWGFWEHGGWGLVLLVIRPSETDCSCSKYIYGTSEAQLSAWKRETGHAIGSKRARNSGTTTRILSARAPWLSSQLPYFKHPIWLIIIHILSINVSISVSQ